MKFLRAFVVALLLGPVTWLAPGPATASTTADCQTLLTTLRGDAVDAQGAFTNTRDGEMLLAKLQDADDKLVEFKNADAVAKLVDYQDRLQLLAGTPKPKVDTNVAADLSAGAQGVFDCIRAIGT